MTDRPLRVAFDARSLSSPVVRGWDRYTIGLVRALSTRGVKVSLLHRRREPVHPSHVAALACPTIGLGDLGGLFWEQVALPRALWAFDIYHAPAEHGVPLLSPCPTVLTLHSATAYSYASLIARELLTGTVRDYLGHDADPAKPTFANGYWRAQVARADAIVTPSAFARDEVVNLMHAESERVTAIPLAVDDAFRAAPAAPAERAALLARLGVRPPYLLYVGGYETHKNVAGLLDVFALLDEREPTLNLVLVGSTQPPDDLRKEIAARGRVRDRVLLLAGLGPELATLYDEAALYVSMSWRESFGLPALEAMTRGTAVVASTWGAAPEVVGEGGTLVDPRDRQAAADAVVALLRDPDRSARARRAAARFSWDSAAEQTLALYRSLTRP